MAEQVVSEHKDDDSNNQIFTETTARQESQDEFHKLPTIANGALFTKLIKIVNID